MRKFFVLLFFFFLSSIIHAGPRVIGNGAKPDVAAQEFVDVSLTVLTALGQSTVRESADIFKATDKLLIGSSNQVLNEKNDDMAYLSYFNILQFRAVVWKALPSKLDRAYFVIRGFLLVAKIPDPNGSKSLEVLHLIEANL